MASSDNLMEQSWASRPTFADGWASDIYTKETDTLAKALQRSVAAASSDGDAFSSIFVKTDMAPTASGCSENEAAATVSKPRRGLPPVGGRVAKRKSRASKRATTMFITVDADNFRQMVQQVTGVSFSGMNGSLPPVGKPVLKPEQHINRIQMGSGSPSFGTLTFLLDGSAASLVAQPPTPAKAVADMNVFEFESFCSFPTLESWKVM